ncbi:MAG: ABC transporter ATP-binding protein [Candidatus Eremiobacteraeota bacterium]|nr:ABC transporter ATP-binding protein [Candidatus Eremiobacteraeota bacterium]
MLARLGSFILDASLEAEAHETLAVIGESGSGKTSLLRCLAGLLRPDCGSITLGDDVWYDGERRCHVPPRRRDVAMVFSSYALFGHLSVFENVAFGLRAAGAHRASVQQRVMAVLELVEASHLAARRAATLSAGESQRVAIARAVAVRPRLLLLDEPLAALDVRVRKTVRASLARAIAASGCTAILVTHEPAEGMLLASRLAVMEDGRFVQAGDLGALRSFPATPYVASFAGVNVFRGAAAAKSDGTSTVAVGNASLIVRGEWSGLVTVVVDEDAVTLTLTQPESSARNRLAGIVESVAAVAGGVAVSLASQPPVVARITHAAAAELDIAAGRRLYASFKAGEARVF